MRRSTFMVGAFLAVTAFSAEPTPKVGVKVQADIVSASETAGGVDASLTRMQQALSTKVKYLSMKKLESKTVELSDVGASIDLPNGKRAEVKLLSVKENVATVSVKLPPTDATYTLAKDKSLYLQGGTSDGGDIWLVLSQPK